MAAKRISKLDSKEALTYTVLKGEGSTIWGGYRRELVTQKLSILEENLMVCSRCAGIMRDACSIKGGLAQVCGGCLGGETESQPVGPIRATVVKLSCRCPRMEKGCEWEGTLGEMDCHLDECNQFIVQCPFVKYGCKKELKRGGLEEHRKEAKEYHTEVVSVFMADKVEKLEEEKRQQTNLIENLQLVLSEFVEMKEYIKINGTTWRIENRHDLKNKIYGLRSQPQNAVAGMEAERTDKYQGDAVQSNWDGPYLDGPRFLVHSYYYFYPRLTIENDPNANLQLISHNIKQCDRYVIWPFEGKCKIIFVNHENEKDPWMYEMNFQVDRGGEMNVTNIPFDVLLDEKYNKDNCLVMKILIKPHP